jgi:hypothetical protein
MPDHDFVPEFPAGTQAQISTLAEKVLSLSFLTRFIVRASQRDAVFVAQLREDLENVFRNWFGEQHS